MKKALAVILSLAVSTAYAQYDPNWRDSSALFDASKIMTDNVSVTWNRVDDIRKTCETESKRRGLGGFGYSMEACSFWGTDKSGKDFCHIFTRKKTTMHDLGHEMRHCFQGAFH